MGSYSLLPSTCNGRKKNDDGCNRTTSVEDPYSTPRLCGQVPSHVCWLVHTSYTLWEAMWTRKYYFSQPPPCCITKWSKSWSPALISYMLVRACLSTMAGEGRPRASWSTDCFVVIEINIFPTWPFRYPTHAQVYITIMKSTRELGPKLPRLIALVVGRPMNAGLCHGIHHLLQRCGETIRANGHNCTLNLGHEDDCFSI